MQHRYLPCWWSGLLNISLQFNQRWALCIFVKERVASHGKKYQWFLFIDLTLFCLTPSNVGWLRREFNSVVTNNAIEKQCIFRINHVISTFSKRIKFLYVLGYDLPMQTTAVTLLISDHHCFSFWTSRRQITNSSTAWAVLVNLATRPNTPEVGRKHSTQLYTHIKMRARNETNLHFLSSRSFYTHFWSKWICRYQNICKIWIHVQGTKSLVTFSCMWSCVWIYMSIGVWRRRRCTT